MRTIGVVTVGRSDYGIYLPVLRAIQRHPDLNLRVIVSGAHLAPEFGMTVRAIEADGFDASDRVEMLLSSDSPEGIAKSMGLGVSGFAQLFASRPPDLLLVLGDRFEMYAAGLAALPFRLPLAHVHGGEVTSGAFDDALRHSLTKLSHLHFVSTPQYARRVEQLGEEPWRVTVSGAPSLDNLRDVEVCSPAELSAQFGIPLDLAPLLVTFHPATLEAERAGDQVRELLEAIDRSGVPAVFTQPNADTAGRLVGAIVDDYVRTHASAYKVDNFGLAGYFGFMRVAAAMVGNSSSGIIEAPSFGLPVVNVGTRQDGRVRAANVIDVGYGREEVLRGIRQALDPAFRARLAGLASPYGDGHAAEIIAERLASVAIDQRLIMKRFHDLDAPDTVSRA